MELWPGILAIVFGLVGGGLLGCILVYLIVTRIQKKPFSMQGKITEQQFEKLWKEALRKQAWLRSGEKLERPKMADRKIY